MVADIQALLRGEIVEVDGRAARMLHWSGQAIERPIEVPWIVAVNGPRGLAAAAEMGCGVFTSRPRPDADYAGIDDVILLGFGTIMDDDETIESPPRARHSRARRQRGPTTHFWNSEMPGWRRFPMRTASPTSPTTWTPRPCTCRCTKATSPS